MDIKVGIGSRIGEEYTVIVDKLSEILNAKKYRIYEASVDIFNALPRILQMALISNDDEVRRIILDTIKQLSMPQQPKKGGKKKL